MKKWKEIEKRIEKKIKKIETTESPLKGIVERKGAIIFWSILASELTIIYILYLTGILNFTR